MRSHVSVTCVSVSLNLWVFLSLSLAERAPAGARDKSPEAGKRGGKNDREKDRTVAIPESRGAGSKREGAGGGRSRRHGQSG